METDAVPKRPNGMYKAHHKHAYIFVKGPVQVYIFLAFNLWGAIWTPIGCHMGPVDLYKAQQKHAYIFLKNLLRSVSF